VIFTLKYIKVAPIITMTLQMVKNEKQRRKRMREMAVIDWWQRLTLFAAVSVWSLHA
jgi:hypothetical protein